MDLKSRLRAIVKPQGSAEGGVPRGGLDADAPKPVRELTYEPDIGAYEAGPTIDRVGEILGGRAARNDFGQCLVIDRRYESDRWHGDVRIADCELGDLSSLGVLDPSLTSDRLPGAGGGASAPRTVFIDLETTGLSGGAGTVAFLVGCGFYDLGAFQVRQFLLTSYSAERALLTAVAEFFDDAELIVSYNGKTFDVPVMETRWLFHRMAMPLDGVPHFDTLHTGAPAVEDALRTTRPKADAGCRRSSGRCSTCGASAMCLDSRSRRASFSSCAAAIRVRSSRCSSTIGSIWSRSPPSRRAPCGSSKAAPTVVPTGRRRWRWDGSSSAPGSSSARPPAIAARRSAT